MAIKFLDNLSLQGNQIENVILDVQTSNPASLGEGQIFYNSGSTEKTIKFRNNLAYKGVVYLPDGGAVDGIIPMISNKYGLKASGAVFSADTNLIVMDTGLEVKNGFYTGTDLFDVAESAGTAGMLLSSKGSGAGVSWIDAPVSYTKWNLTADNGGITAITDGATVEVVGGNSITTKVTAGEGIVTVGLDAFVKANTLEVALTSLFKGQLTIPEVPASKTDAASKGYVDQVTAGGLIYQGGYNASSNTPVLDSRGSQIAVEKGWTYTVTADGTFYGETVRIGDVLISEVDNTAGTGVLTDWTTVQNNIDLASASQVGIGNVKELKDSGISVAYSAGTASVGFSINTMTADGTALDGKDEFALYKGTGEGLQVKTTLEDIKTFAGGGGGFVGTSESGTTHTFNHLLGSQDVMVQIFDTTSFETVYASVDRTTVNQVVVTTAKSAAIKCLIQKIG